MLKGFREFISRGNVVDMAVGVIIGGAFAPIVKTLTDNVLMAIIAGVFGAPSFEHVLEFHIGSSLVQPGMVINAIINFLIVAAALYFAVVLPMNKFRQMQEARAKAGEVEETAEEAPAADIALLTEIRDLLASKN